MDYFIGTILPSPGNVIPGGWALCDGRPLSTGMHTALFSLIGYTYGGHGGTFHLPDLRGRTPIGAGVSEAPFYDQPITLETGAKGGAETVIMTTHNLPQHTHSAQLDTLYADLMISRDPAKKQVPGWGMMPAALKTDDSNGYSIKINGYARKSSNTINLSAVHLEGVNTSVTNENAGGSQPINIMNPYIAVNYIICLQGIMPGRE